MSTHKLEDLRPLLVQETYDKCQNEQYLTADEQEELAFAAMSASIADILEIDRHTVMEKFPEINTYIRDHYQDHRRMTPLERMLRSIAHFFLRLSDASK